MTQYEQPKSKAAEQMQFAGDFDDGLTVDEKLEAAANFDDLVGSMLSRFDGSVITYDHAALRPDMTESSLELAVFQDEDGSSITAQVELLVQDDGSEIRNIFIYERQRGRAQKRHRYYREDGGDGAVIRYDSDLVKARYQPLYERRKQDKLEQELGLNLQPVGIDEINKLAQLLESAQPKHSKRY